MFGSPGATQFRAEYSYASSPKAESDAQGDLLSSIHHETIVSRFSGDLLMKGLLFSGKSIQTKQLLAEPYDHVGEKFSEKVTTNTEGGVLWIPQEGLVLGFYFAAESTSYFYEDEHTEFRINLAYIFQ